jgi:RNA polymerase sigma factor (sigma-70 family)
MGSLLIVPDDIQAIFEKGGSTWNEKETIRVIEWLNEPARLGRFLRFGLRSLGHGATSQDTEDAWQEFFTPRTPDHGRHFNRVVDTYDPTIQRFQVYFNSCWIGFCRERRRPLGRRLAHERTGVFTIRDGDNDEKCELEVVDDHPESDPVEVATRRERRGAVLDCLNQLDDLSRTIVVEHYLEGTSFEEIALELGISESNAKVKAFRARQQLPLCMMARIREAKP